MKNRLLYIGSIVLLALAGVVFPAQPAEAHHYTYLAEDPEWQLPQSPLTDNWVMFKWWDGQPVTWYADGSIFFDVQAAINNWYGIFPELVWLYTGDEVNAEVRFYYFQCPDWPSLLGCMVPITWQNRDPNETPFYPENASYMDQVNIWINPSFPWTTSTRIAQIAHEVGHVYGLSEKYIEPNLCNPDERSIMEVIQANIPPNQCDYLEGPTALDNQNVRWYWGQSMYSINKSDILFTGAGFNTLGIWRWKDLSWAENAHQVAWYWWNGSQWIMYRDETFVDWIGVHFLTDDRVLYRYVDRTAYPLVTGPGWHKMCGKPWFKATGQFGNYRCSNLEYLN